MVNPGAQNPEDLQSKEREIGAFSMQSLAYRALSCNCDPHIDGGDISAPEQPSESSMSQSGKNGLTYSDAGVDIDAGNLLVEKIKPAVRSTRRPGADGEIGGFGGLFDSQGRRLHRSGPRCRQ